MAEEYFVALPSFSELAEAPKRKRTPSQYAAQIDDFKNNLTPKKAKSFRLCPSGIEVQEDSSRCDSNVLPCKLSNGRIFSLKIILSPLQQNKVQKTASKVSKRMEIPPEPKMEEKKNGGPQSLLDKFLSVFINMQKQKEIKAKQIAELRSEWKTPKNMDKRRLSWEHDLQKEKDERWWKSHEKCKAFSKRLDTMEEKYIFLN